MADLEDLFTKLNMISPLSERLRDKLSDLISEERLPKKHLLLKEGYSAKKIFFLKKGFARCYYYDGEDKEQTTWFLGDNDFVISVFSFLTQQPSYENIELLSNSVIQSMTWNNLQTIYKDFPEFNYIGRIITEGYYVESEKRGILLRTKSPKERYNLLLKTFPNILQKASLGQISTYLGITPETLSRVRGKK
jgi:CRP-like cAMP-binding protein